MSSKVKVYYHWYVHWDLHKVMAALAAYYGLEYKADDAESTMAVVTRTYEDYYGVHDLTTDTHMRCITDQVREMLKDEDPVAPDCVRYQAFLYVSKEAPGFDLKKLVGPPPYPDNWEKPRPKFEGEIAQTHYAF